MSNINISVIIPIYDYSIYIPNCLNSILNQNLDNIEIILLNNSKRNIKKLMELYVNKFDNIKIISNESSQLDFNLAINEANGKYVSFIDSNDYIKEDMLEKMFKVCENNKLDIAMCKLLSIDDLTSDLDNDLHDLSLYIFNDLKKEIFDFNDISNFSTEIYSKPFNKLFNRSFLIENNVEFPNFLFSDEVFFYDTFLKARKISIVNDYLYVRRFNNRFTKDLSFNDYSSIIQAFKLIRNAFIEKDYWNSNKITIYNYFIKLILYYFDLSSDEHKETFFNEFKNVFQKLMVEDNVMHEIDANSLVKINKFFYANSFSELIHDSEKIFSVIIQCKNVEDSLENSINSVINQTLDFETFIEIILVDESSDDSTIDICQKYLELYPNNIKLLHQFNNQISVRDLGLKEAGGKYINFLDASEILGKDTFSKAYNYFEKNYDDKTFVNFPLCFYGDDYLKLDNDYKKIFSVVIPCYNVENYIGEAIDSIINQTLDFESFIEIILVDDGSDDSTPEICRGYLKQYPNNIKYLHQKNKGQASARNLGLKHVSAKYINFLDADDTLMEDTFSNVYDFFEKHYEEIDLVAFPMYFFGKKTGNHILNYKFKEDLVVSLDKFWDYPQLSASSAVFKRELFDKFEFDTNLISSEDSVMVNKILLEKRAYGVIESGGYNYRKRFDESSTIDTSINNPDYYNNRLKGYFIELINYSKYKMGFVPKFIQYLIVYDIQWMFLSDDKFSMFDSQEVLEFKKNLRYIFANIEDEVISFHFKNDPYKLKLFMFKLKHDEFEINNVDGVISLNVNGHELDVLNKHVFYIDIVEIKNNMMFISGVFSHYYDKNNFDVVLTKYSNVKENYYPNYVSYSNRRESNFSESKLCFDFEVPLTQNENVEIQLNLMYNMANEDIIVNLPIKFLNHARMSETCNYSIWGDYFIEFKNNKFIISDYSYLNFLRHELSILIKIFKAKEPYWTSSVAFHFIYLVLFIFYKNKKIWMVMDRQDRADDNAEHLFNYMKDINDGIKKYFTVSSESNDYPRLSSKWKNVLPFYSIKQRILFLFADKVISSQADEEIINPFWGKNIKLYSGLLTADKIFLQHGVAKDDMSTWLRKYDKNVKLLVTTSDIEAKSFDDYEYNYAEGVVQVLGLPRYDNLSNESDNKQILIMPSWRRSLNNAEDSQIQNSEYFKRFNSLINNDRLIDFAKSLGYKIIFKPHPNTFKFIELFDTNDYVIMDDKSKYQELFNNSSLLITDYSSLSFDFAYIKKPIIYYQYGNDYHFGNNFFEFETMGFGEVIKDENELIDTIEEYLNNDCQIKDIYLERSNSFYKFNDRNNCKRVYDAIKKI